MSKLSSDSSEKAEFWAAAMELFRQSGLGCVDFCNREGLAYSTFCRWRDKLADKKWAADDNRPSDADTSEFASLAEISLDGCNSDVEAKFVSAGVVELGGTQRTAGIEVRFSSGVSINVQKDFDRKVFKDVVAILGAELC